MLDFCLKQMEMNTAWETRKQKITVQGLILLFKEVLYNSTFHLNAIEFGHRGNLHSESP
jgi:hypothetical protein